MRIGYLDEAGRSRNEPTIVVAGIVINGDRTYRKLEERLKDIAQEFLPDADRKGFVFHAVDVFRGTGYFKDHALWPRERRFPILRALAAVPHQFGIPVVFAYVDKAEYRESVSEALSAYAAGKERDHATDVAEHMMAFLTAEIAIEPIEQQMARYPRDEICMLIAEDTDRVKKAVKSAHSLARDPDELTQANTPGLPLRKIVDTPHFAAKAESPPLQLADVCAYLILRRLHRRAESQEFFEQISPQLTWNARAFGEAMGAEQIGGGLPY